MTGTPVPVVIQPWSSFESLENVAPVPQDDTLGRPVVLAVEWPKLSNVKRTVLEAPSCNTGAPGVDEAVLSWNTVPLNWSVATNAV